MSEFLASESCPIQESGDLKGVVAERGPWIFTTTGGRYFPTTPRPEEVHIWDIAHALAYLNRYTGHARFPVSVAQHSVLCARLAPQWIALEALLHDAAEAYLGDVSRPVKQFLKTQVTRMDCCSYCDLEKLNLDAISARFGLRWDDETWRRIREVDNLALAIEVRDAHCPEFHRLLEERGIRADPNWRVQSITPQYAKRRFMEEFERLRRDR